MENFSENFKNLQPENQIIVIFCILSSFVHGDIDFEKLREYYKAIENARK